MERALVELARDGDEGAFAGLVNVIGDRLYSIAFQILRDVPSADDAAQQALIGIWRHLPELQDVGRFDAWAYRIVVREAWAEARRQRARRPGILQFRIARDRVDDEAGRVADHDRLERAFCRLSREHRTAVVLKHYVGLGDEEIAEVLDVPAGTVRSRLFYAMRTLRAAIEADERATVEDLA